MNTVLAAIALALGTLASCAHAGPPAQARPASLDEAPATGRLLVMLRMPPQHFRPGPGYGAGYPADSTRPARRRVAEALALEHGLRVVDDWPMPVIGIDCFVMETGAGVSAEPVLAALARDARVAWAQPFNQYHSLDGGDPLYPVQPDAMLWHLAQLHRHSTGRGVRVAIVDSGVDVGHPDLAGQVELHENFVDDQRTPPEAHGTAVAGIMVARAGNGVGIAGVAPDAKLMALRGCWQAPGQAAQCNSFTLGKALNFAVMHDARIINLSLAGPSDRLLQALLDAAAARGATVVAAADPQRADGGFPASWPGVLAVAAQSSSPVPDTAQALPAPGTDIPTCLPGSRWGFVSGSSYASAHVSGLVALLAQLLPQANPAQLKRNIVLTPDPPALRRTANRAHQEAAARSIDACATIERAAGACTCSCPLNGEMKTSDGR